MYGENMIARIKVAILIRLAKALKPYLARQPVIWGDSSRLIIGNNVHLVDAVINLRSGYINIEDDVFFGHSVMLLTGKHSLSKRGSDRQKSVPSSGRDITIHKGAWIASGAIIIGPCEIGEHAIIGAGAVVKGFIPAGSLFTGNPAKLIRTSQS